MTKTASPVFPDLAPAAISFVQSPMRKKPPGVISRTAKGAPDRGPERGEVALSLERRHYHRPELEVLTQSNGSEVKNELVHLVGVDDDVGGGVDGEEDVVDLDEDHHPGGVLLKPPILHHLDRIMDQNIIVTSMTINGELVRGDIWERVLQVWKVCQ